MSKKKKDLVVIGCPSYKKYNEPLQDQSHSELYDCPYCKEKMWLSDKKKGLLMFASVLAKDILLGCWDCVKNTMEEEGIVGTKITKVEL